MDTWGFLCNLATWCFLKVAKHAFVDSNFTGKFLKFHNSTSILCFVWYILIYILYIFRVESTESKNFIKFHPISPSFSAIFHPIFVWQAVLESSRHQFIGLVQNKDLEWFGCRNKTNETCGKKNIWNLKGRFGSTHFPDFRLKKMGDFQVPC